MEKNMSRTYRRQKGHRFWTKCAHPIYPHYGVGLHYEPGQHFKDDWKYNPEETAHFYTQAYIESDNFASHQERRAVKGHTRRARRSNERQQMDKVKRLDVQDDYDFVCREKKYLGVIWFYD